MNRKEFMLSIIKELGAFQLSHFKTDISYDNKTSDTDIVSFVDTESQKMFEDKVRGLFPDDEILGEETFDEHKEYSTKSLWIIDPLDGTLMYQRGFSGWGPMIVYIKNGEIQFSSLFMPLLDELFFADSSGSYCNGKEISVSKVDSLQASLLDVKPQDMSKLLPLVGRVHYHDAAISHYTGVATGKTEGYVNLKYGSNSWDLLPGLFLIQQAGGKVTTVSGESITLLKREGFIASNGKIHSDLLKVSSK